MSTVVLRVMLLALLRDRAALIMSFIVPVVFFVIFASIFAAGDKVRFTLTVADLADSETSDKLVRDVLEFGDFVLMEGAEPEPDGVRHRVRSGAADVGLIVRTPATGQPNFVVVGDPIRSMAAKLLIGQLKQVYVSALLADFKRDSDAAAFLPPDVIQVMDVGDAAFFERESVVGPATALNKVAYYAGGVAVLFLLFSTVHGAISLLEESELGVLDRILLGPGSTFVLINGKFLYLVMQGFVQVSVIFVVAWLLHGVDLPKHWLLWAITTLIASAAAAGLALALVTACRTRRQAQSLSSMAILVISALGGSMVPRFAMPPVLHELGWFTPNAWALEAYVGIFWRGDPIAELMLPWLVLLAAALIGLAVSHVFAHRLLWR